MKRVLIVLAMFILLGCEEPQPTIYVSKGVVIKLIVREETALSSRKEHAIVQGTNGCRYKLQSDYYLVGDSVTVYSKQYMGETIYFGNRL